MNKINLCDYFTELYERPLKVVTNGKGCTIQATDRNTLKQEIMATFKEFLAQNRVRKPVTRTKNPAPWCKILLF